MSPLHKSIAHHEMHCPFTKVKSKNENLQTAKFCHETLRCFVLLQRNAGFRHYFAVETFLFIHLCVVIAENKSDESSVRQLLAVQYN